MISKRYELAKIIHSDIRNSFRVLIDFMNKYELEKLINKPRAFRNAFIAENIPVRRTMILLGSETPTTYSTPRNYKKLMENRKYKNNEPIF